MSRFSAQVIDKPEHSVLYGLDHVLGWWYQEYDGDDECIIDKDTMTNRLTKGQLVELLEKTDAPKKHLQRIAMDLDPK